MGFLLIFHQIGNLEISKEGIFKYILTSDLIFWLTYLFDVLTSEAINDDSRTSR